MEGAFNRTVRAHLSQFCAPHAPQLVPSTRVASRVKAKKCHVLQRVPESNRPGLKHWPCYILVINLGKSLHLSKLLNGDNNSTYLVELFFGELLFKELFKITLKKHLVCYLARDMGSLNVSYCYDYD